MNTICGVVMAGGQSSRMGQDKGLTLLNGKPLVQYSIELLQQFTQHIVISTNQQTYTQFGFPLIADEHTNIGPLGGLHAVLKNSQAMTYLIMGCDLPHMHANLFKKLLRERKHAEVAILVHNGKIEPLCAVYTAYCLNTIEQQIQQKQYKLQHLLNKCETAYVEARSVQHFSPRWLTNMNTKDDLKT